ncbi:glycosyltransferase [Luteimonas sp. A611]
MTAEAAAPAGLRIALLLPDLDVGGAQRTVLTLAREMHATGNAVDIISLTTGGPLADECPPGVRLVTLAPRGTDGAKLFAGSLAPLRNYLVRTRPDALLSTITGCNLLACVAHWFGGRGCRLVLREAVSLRNASGLRRRAVRWLYPRADAVVALSDSLADELRQLGLRPADVHVIPNPVDGGRLRALAAQPLPAALQGRRFVACVGRLVEQKDPATALRAFATASNARDHVLAVAGDGPLRDALHALASQLGLDGRLAWLGEMRNPYPVMAGADALLLTSRWEGSPNVLLEAMALGTPIVATDCPGGVRELLREVQGDVPNLPIPTDDVPAVAAALERVLASSARPASQVPSSRRPADVARLYLRLLAPATRDCA